MGMSPTEGINLQSKIGRDQNMKNVGAQARGAFAQSVGEAAHEATSIAMMYFRPNPQQDRGGVGYAPPEENTNAAPAQTPQAAQAPPAPIKLAELGLPPGTAGNTVNVFNKEGIG